MCGRFTLKCSPAQLAEAMPDWPALEARLLEKPRYNIAPTQPVVSLRCAEMGVRPADDNPPVFDVFQWGLVPGWIRETQPAQRHINARSEEAAVKPAFRGAMRHRRCLVPATGFYEWTEVDGQRQPYYFSREDGQPFALAGLWEIWLAPDGSELRSCSLLTTRASDLLADLHHRMPVILPREHHDAWLHPERLKPAEATALCRPTPAKGWQRHAVSTRVNSFRPDDARLVEPVEPIRERALDFMDQLFAQD
ncbi:MAG: SOS response-associated peptidase [Verrucomicrobiota bacterium JB022]|nr:SOS response-associated peptidase [Verrucomicrobiota bacterium JB022]